MKDVVFKEIAGARPMKHLIEISILSEKHSRNIQLINNSDKSSDNTLQLSSRTTG